MFQEASRSAVADAEADLSLLRQLLQSAAGQKASHKFNAAEVSNACHMCCKVRIYIASDAMQLCNRLILHALLGVWFSGRCRPVGPRWQASGGGAAQELPSKSQMVTRIQHIVYVQAGFRLAPGVMQSLLVDYSSIGSDATSLQPQIADAAAAFLKLAKTALLSKG